MNRPVRLLVVAAAVSLAASLVSGGEQRPSLRASASPPLALLNVGIGGASVTVRFRIEGTLNEEWHCPKLTVEWPDGTRTGRESDCEPWPAESVASWPGFTRVFPAGTYVVRGCLSKAGRVLACTEVQVRVVGGE